jgi:hypothetical protein
VNYKVSVFQCSPLSLILLSQLKKGLKGEIKGKIKNYDHNKKDKAVDDIQQKVRIFSR